MEIRGALHLAPPGRASGFPSCYLKDMLLKEANILTHAPIYQLNAFKVLVPVSAWSWLLCGPFVNCGPCSNAKFTIRGFSN